MRRFADAEKAQREALKLFAEDDRPEEYWEIRNDLAMTLHYRGRPTDALEMLYETRDSVRGRDTERITLANIGRILLSLSRPRDAKAVLLEARALHAGWRTVDTGLLKATLGDLLKVHIALGEDAEAEAVRRCIADIDAPWLN
jgi:Flp pilus assembly protein TadD